MGAPHGSPPLIDELLAEGPGLDRSKLGGVSHQLNADAIDRTAVDCLRQAAQLVEQKAGAEHAAEYGRFVCAVADWVAEAHKEGSLLGIGGTRISDAEQADIDHISAVINTTSLS